MSGQKKRKTLSERAYDIIKASIENNEYQPGVMLSEKQLCEKMNMSRTPIREALQKLVTEDLIEVRDGVGTFVKERSQEDIEDAYELRRSLELLAIKTAIYEFTEEELDQLEHQFSDIYERFRRNVSVSVDECEAADWLLHDMIIRKSKNRYIGLVMEVIRTPLKRYQSMSVKVAMNTEKATKEHLAIVEAIRSRDEARVKIILEEHIRY